MSGARYWSTSLQKLAYENFKSNWRNNFSRPGPTRPKYGVYENICTMKPENKQFLEDNRHHWITLRDAQFCRMLDAPTRERMMLVMAEEFRPGYTADLWCPPCLSDMVTQLYTEFEKWEVAEADRVQVLPGSEPDASAQIVVGVPTPEPVQVKASFPSHKHRRK
jgi:hypothetical protein